MLKNAKKLLSLLLVLSMVLSVMSGLSLTAFAEDTATITVESKTVNIAAEKEVELSVTIANNPGFCGAAFEVNVGDAPLTFAGATVGELTANAVVTAGTRINIDYPFGDIHGDGEILKIRFTVNDGATNGAYSVGLGLFEDNPGNFSDSEENIVPVTLVPGTVTLTGAAEVPTVPTLKAGVQDKTDVVVTGQPYLLNELQNGEIFEAPSGKTQQDLTYWYERSADNGASFGAKTKVIPPDDTVMNVREDADGTYIYRFYASCDDGQTFSEDFWTLTLTASKTPIQEYTFYVGKSYDGESYGTLYVDKLDDAGNTAATSIQGEDGAAQDGYMVYKAKLAAGRYQLTLKNGEAVIGGMALDLPTEGNVTGGVGGGTQIYLRCVSFYVSSKKNDGTSFTADDFTIEVDCPKMSCKTLMGAAYEKDGKTYYPTYLYANGNGCLYNIYAIPSDKTVYAMSQKINQTYAASAAPQEASMTISPAVKLTVTAPKDATFQVFFQKAYYNDDVIEPTGAWTENGDTKTAVFYLSRNNSNYSWRLTQEGKTTKAGWLSRYTEDTALTVDFNTESVPLSSRLADRDEADLYVNGSPTGFVGVTDSKVQRVRAFRLWEIIDSDTSNIEIQPDFHWTQIDFAGLNSPTCPANGGATVAEVSGGNGHNNWADFTPGKTDTLFTVTYDAIDVDNTNNATYGGTYPAVSANRFGIVVVGGTESSRGDRTVTIDRGADEDRAWDYNYDTWYYTDTDNKMNLTFSTSAAVRYFFYAMDKDGNIVGKMVNGGRPTSSYTLDLSNFDSLGTGEGGTLVIRMSDAQLQNKISYQLVHVAKLKGATYVNAEDATKTTFLPGDKVQVKLDGVYRGVQKMSGIFNPQPLKYVYTDGTQNFATTTKETLQYRVMDNVTFTVTLPAQDKLTFNDEGVATYTLTNGWVNGQMWGIPLSASNLMYTMTDSGLPTNFNAVQVQFNTGRLPKLTISVQKPEKIPDGAWDGKTYTEPKLNGEWYEIYTGAELAWFAQHVNEGNAAVNAKLMNDIDLSGKQWPGIGESAKKPFSGKFDGQGFAVKNLLVKYTDVPEATGLFGAGLFGVVKGTVEIKDLTVEGVVNGLYSGDRTAPVGGVVGLGYDTNLTLTNVVNKADVSASRDSKDAVGGVVGAMDVSSTAVLTMTGCANFGKVTANTMETGGLVGRINGGSITKSYNTGAVTMQDTFGIAGGLVGSSRKALTLTESYNTGAVANTANGFGSYTAGLIGEMQSKLTLKAAYNTGAISGAKTNASGLFGTLSEVGANSTVASCYNAGTVTSSYSAAAIAGFYKDGNTNVTFTDVYYLGTLPAAKYGSDTDVTLPGVTGIEDTEIFKQTVIALDDFARDAKNINGGFPILKWQSDECQHLNTEEKVTANNDGTHTITTVCKDCGETVKTETKPCENDGTGKCKVCGADLTPKPVDGWYEIGTADQLKWLAEQVNSGAGKEYKAKLIADIDLKSEKWTPIGENTANPFTGVFDGQGHTISGLNVNVTSVPNTTYSYGLFGVASGTVEIKNVTVKGTVSVKNGSANLTGTAGVLGRCLDNKTTVTMTDVISYVDVSYESSDIGTYVAGLIGASQNGKITLLRCANLGAITGKSFAVGGLVGYLTSGSSIKECYNAGSVTQNKNDIAGGLVGKLDGGTIEDCYNNASVKACFTSGRATGTAGGLAGNIDNGAIKNCYNAGEVSAVQTGTVAGSIRALEDLTQTNCYVLTAPAYGNKKDDTSVSVKTADELRALAATLGAAFAKDTAGINGGYPILKWQATGETCKHEHTENKYVSTNDGKHTIQIVCSDCGEMVNANAGTEDCADTDKDGKCDKCGYQLACVHAEKETTYTYIESSAAGNGKHTVTVTCKSCKEVLSTTEEACSPKYGECEKCHHVMVCKHPQTQTTYTDNNNGTHTVTVTCKECKAVLSTETEDCREVSGWVNTSATTGYETSVCEKCNHLFEGTKDHGVEWFVIYNEYDLRSFAARINRGEKLNAKLTGGFDFDVTDGWTPIGTPEHPFTGRFEGQGYTIKLNLNETIEGDKDGYYGLFGVVENPSADRFAMISNLKVEGSITVTNNAASGRSCFIGGLAAKVTRARIENVVTNVNIKMTGSNTNGCAGGIVGYEFNVGTRSYIWQCGSNGTIETTGMAGGIVGNGLNTIIDRCYNKGAITGGAYAGGIAGDGSTIISVTNSYNRAKITGTGSVGGIFGAMNGKVENCFTDGEVSGPNGTTGLFAGVGNLQTSELKKCLVDMFAAFNTPKVGNDTDEDLNVETFAFVETDAADQLSAEGCKNPYPGMTTAESAYYTEYKVSLMLKWEKPVDCNHALAIEWPARYIGNDQHVIRTRCPVCQYVVSDVVESCTYDERGLCTVCNHNRMLDKVLTGITVTTQPTKLVYVEGESFDPTGMVVTASYRNGETETITGYTYAPTGALTTGNHTITITYVENGVTVTATVAITVNEKQPAVQEYTITFDANGGIAAYTSAETVNGKLSSLPSAVRSGYTFVGWFSSIEGGSLVTTNTVFSENATVYAHWNENSTPDKPEKPSYPTIPSKPGSSKFPFTDVGRSDDCYDAVKYLYENEIMNGTSATQFSPNAELTRGMVVTILYRMEGEPFTLGSKSFSDVKAGRYYSEAVEWAAENGIVNGFTDGTFKPDQAVTREQLASILRRYASFSGIATYDAELPANASVSNWAKKDVAWAYAEGILTSAQTAAAAKNANRAEVAMAIYAYLTGTAR